MVQKCDAEVNVNECDAEVSVNECDAEVSVNECDAEVSVNECGAEVGINDLESQPVQLHLQYAVEKQYDACLGSGLGREDLLL